jgi:D-alanyl-D-alanine carboxypeptidase
MSAHVLAITFVLLMVQLTLFNRWQAERANTQVPEPPKIIASLSQPRAAPSAAPSPTPSPIISSSSTPTPSPTGQIMPYGAQEVPPLPKLTARAYLLVERGKGVRLAKNESAYLPIASVAKLMTALVFQEHFPDDARVTISDDDLKLSGNTVGLAAGDTLAKDEALKILLVTSNNAVAQAMAEAVGEADFLKLMNARARSLGMVQTFFADATGLSELTRSTPNDLVILLDYLSLSAPEILGVTRTPNWTLFTRSEKRYELRNTNELLGTVQGIVGGKTGYTDAAGGCLVTVFEWRRRTFYAVVLGSADRFADMRALIEYAWNLQ